MTLRDETTWCDGCGVEITWGPVAIDGQHYCCQDCAQGLTCSCGERMEMDEELRGSGTEATPAYTGNMP